MKKLRIGSLLLIVLLLTGCSLEGRLDRIDGLIESKSYKKAERLVAKEINRDGKNKEAYDRLLKIYRETSRDREKVLREALDKFDDLDYKRDLADIYYSKGKTGEALSLYRDLVVEEKSQENFERLFDLYLQEDDRLGLVESFEANRTYIDDDKIILRLALVYLDLGNEGRGLDLVAGLDQDQLRTREDIEVFELLAEYYFKINDYERSYKIVGEGLRLDPGESILYGYRYGFLNSDGLILRDVQRADINGDGRMENIILLSESKDIISSGNTILTVQDGSQGEILGKKRMEGYIGYRKMKFFDFNGDGVEDIYLEKFIHGGMEARPEIYSFLDNDFVLLTQDYGYSDIDYILEDDFKVLIYSVSKKIKKTLDLDENRKDYLDLGIYSSDGGLLEGNLVEAGPTSYGVFYRDKSKRYGIRESFDLLVEGRELARLNLTYLYGKKTMELVDFDLDSSYPIKSAKYEGEKISLIDNLDIKDLSRLLKMSKKEVYLTYGRPRKIDYLNGEILDYNGIQFFIDQDQVSLIRVLDSRDIVGLSLPASYDHIVRILGPATKEGGPEDYVDEYKLIYEKEGLEFKFSGRRDREDSFILYIEKIKKKESN